MLLKGEDSGFEVFFIGCFHISKNEFIVLGRKVVHGFKCHVLIIESELQAVI